MKQNSSNKSVQTRRKNVAKLNKFASLGALYMGGICPIIALVIAHYQAPNLSQLKDMSEIPASSFLWVIVLGLLAYSAPLVASWFSKYVGGFKAWGFVCGMEVTMIFSNEWTAFPALLTMIGLNAMILRQKFLETK